MLGRLQGGGDHRSRRRRCSHVRPRVDAKRGLKVWGHECDCPGDLGLLVVEIDLAPCGPSIRLGPLSAACTAFACSGNTCVVSVSVPRVAATTPTLPDPLSSSWRRHASPGFMRRRQGSPHRHASDVSDHVASASFESVHHARVPAESRSSALRSTRFRKAASPASDTSTHFGSGEASAS
jgi:hypothetical protein